LNPSAAWVGEPVDFVVEIDTAPGVDVNPDDLAQDKLTLQGLEAESSDHRAETHADGRTVQRWTYRLVAWEIGKDAKTIGEIAVRYRSAGASLETTVPGRTLAVRSALPDDGSADGTLAAATATPPPAWLDWLRPAGLALIAMSLAPLALGLAALIRRPRVKKVRVSSRTLQARNRAMFDDVAALDLSTPAGRRRAYDRIDAGIREHLEAAASVPARALTSAELRTRLAAATPPVAGADGLFTVLAECEVARHAPEPRVPDADTVRASVASLQAVLGVR
jgi:hypothetical protein